MNTGQALVVLVTAQGEKFERDRFVEVLRGFPEVRSIHWAVNDTPAEVTNVPSTLLWGEDAIEEELLGLRFRVRPNAFLQTNTKMAERLYGLAIDFAGLTGGETVYDLYCGIGTIGLSMAARALTVWGVEVEEESVACALENADLNGITNAAFYAGNVGQVLAGAARSRRRAGHRRRRSAARRPRGQGAEARGGDRARRGSSTSRAIRRRSPATRSGCARSTATSSCARARSTCFRTRPTSRPWRLPVER